MDHCHHCKSGDIHRSRTNSTWETWRKRLTGKRPFRCRACGWRGWGIDPGPRFSEADIAMAARAVAPEPLDLSPTGLAAADLHGRVGDLRAMDDLLPASEITPPVRSRRPATRK